MPWIERVKYKDLRFMKTDVSKSAIKHSNPVIFKDEDGAIFVDHIERKKIEVEFLGKEE